MNLPLALVLAITAPLFVSFKLSGAEPESIVTGPLGFVRITAEAGETTPIGISMVNPTLGGGTIEAVNGNVITLNTELHSGTGPSYLEITSDESPFVGDRFDVVSVDGAAVTIDNSESSFSTIYGALPGALVNATVVHREHVTLGQLEDWLPSGSGFVGNRFSSNADNLILYRNGIPFQYHRNPFGVWTRPGVTDASDVVLEPGEGFLFYRQPFTDDLVFVIPGGIRTNDFRQNLRKGFSLLATGFPFDVSLEERGFIEINGFQASRFMAQADQILVPGNFGFYDNYYLRAGSDWGVPIGFKFDATSAVFLQKRKDDYSFFSLQPFLN